MSREVWVALHLPALSLEAFLATLPADERQRPLAVLDGGRIGRVNAAAAALGVQPGQARATALALAPGLRLGLADAARDAQACEAVAHVALQFTPAVSWGDDATALLEVAATLRLWGGLDRLLQRLREALAPLGHRAVVACAPTPLGAAMVALAAGDAAGSGSSESAPGWVALPPIQDLATLRRRLDRLPLALAVRGLAMMTPSREASPPRRAVSRPTSRGASSKTAPRAAMAGRAHRGPSAGQAGGHQGDEALQAMIAMGLHTLGDLRALPRDGLARRFGPGWLVLLDRARGDAPDPREPLRPREAFETRIELFHRADQGLQVAEGAQPLLARLVAWAQARQGRIEAFTLAMRHEPRHRHDDRTPEATRLALSVAEPTNDLAHLAMLLRERLARLSLPAPTLELVLCEARLVHAPPPQDQLFPTPACARTNLTRLFERLQARLGAQGILQLQSVPDHRPERATRLVASVPSMPAGASGGAGTGARAPARARDGAGLGDEAWGNEAGGDEAGGDEAGGDAAGGGGVSFTASPPQALTRPAWLLPDPQPLAPMPGMPDRDRPWLHGRPLRLLSGPERIESGWWDGDPVARDYFIAVDEDGVLSWVYRQRLDEVAPSEGVNQAASGAAQAAACWYLHGWFG